MAAGDLDALLAEQSSYYRAVAPEYEEGALELPGGGQLEAAIEAFAPSGEVLELACGPGIWTPQLLRHAETLTAVDGSSEMLALAAERVGAERRVRFIEADLFRWRPDRAYDVVFFGFWLSHVPPGRFERFWSFVDQCLRPGGRIFFVDDGYITAEERIEGESPTTIRRRLKDGADFRVVKVQHDPSELEQRLAELGWEIAVSQSAGPFYWGEGRRAD